MLIHTATPDRHRQDCFDVSGVAVWTESARQPDRCTWVWSAERTCPAVNSRRPTPDNTRQDYRACQSTAAATHARQAATPSRLTAHTQRRCTPRKCKHVMDYCIWLNPNVFTKRHAMRVIYRLTVQTLPDGLETQFTRPDTTQTALAGGVNSALYDKSRTNRINGVRGLQSTNV